MRPQLGGAPTPSLHRPRLLPAKVVGHVRHAALRARTTCRFQSQAVAGEPSSSRQEPAAELSRDATSTASTSQAAQPASSGLSQGAQTLSQTVKQVTGKSTGKGKRRGKGGRQQKAHKKGPSPAFLMQRIQTVEGLAQLQSLVRSSGKELNGVHVSSILLQLVSYAEQDPALWFFSPGDNMTPGSNPFLLPSRGQAPMSGAAGGSGPSSRTSGIKMPSRMQASAATGSMWDAGPDDDWGMSDGEEDEDADSNGRAGLGPSSLRYAVAAAAGGRRWPGVRLSPMGRAEAVKRLSSLLMEVAELAGKVAGKGLMDSTAVSVTLSSLAKLGYRKSKQLRPILEACPPTMASSSPQALANMLWAAAMLKLSPGAKWLEAAESALAGHVERLTPRELCTCVYALGLLGHRPRQDIMRAVCVRAERLLPMCRPSDLANLASGLAGMRHLPDDAWMRTYLATTMPRLRGYQLRDLHRTLAALAALNCKPDDAWLAEFYSSCRAFLEDEAPGRSTLSARMMGSMAFSLARLNCRPDIRWMDTCLQRSKRALGAASTAELTQLISALAMLRYRPGDPWLQAFLMSSFQQLESFSPEHTVGTLQALARLGQRPPGMWLGELANKVQMRLQQFSGEQLADLVTALARLRFRPRASWLADFENASQSKLVLASAGGLASTVWALAEMRHQPQVSWLYSFVLAAYGRLDSFDAGQLGVVFDALPRVSPHPNWLDELVQICASETGMRERATASGSWDESVGDLDASAGPGDGPDGYEEVQGRSGAGASADGNGASSGNGRPTEEYARGGVAMLGFQAPGDGASSNGAASGGGGGGGSGLWSIQYTNGEAVASAPTPLRIYGLNGTSSSMELQPVGLQQGEVRVRGAGAAASSGAAPASPLAGSAQGQDSMAGSNGSSNGLAGSNGSSSGAVLRARLPGETVVSPA